MYSEFKKELGECCVEYLKPIQNEYYNIIKDKSYLNDILKYGAEKAKYKARKTLSKVYRKVGLVPYPR